MTAQQHWRVTGRQLQCAGRREDFRTCRSLWRSRSLRLAILSASSSAQILFALSCFLAPLRAASVHTLDGRSFDGHLRFNNAGAIVVESTNGPATAIELSNIAQATFAPGPFFSSGSVLPNGWSVQDIGEIRGFSRLDDDAFTFRVEGQSTNATACHFVSRPMHSDGGIVARVEQVGGDRQARAGIMIRASHSSVFMALSSDRDGKVWFERRPDSERKEIRATVLATMAAPLWLRLEKRDKSVAAMFSKDGRSWQTVTDSIKLQPEKTWREGEGDLQLLRASFGVFASSRGKDTICTARVTQVAMTQQGLLGEYFSARRFDQSKFARLDPEIRFSWRRPPDPLLQKEDYSVRWTGKLVPQKTGAYRFHFDGGDGAEVRLWIDREEMPRASFKKQEKHAGVPVLPLVAGKAVEVKMEFVDGQGPAAVKLGWALPGRAPEVIGMSNFIFPFHATNSPERILAGLAANDIPVRGILLRDGSFIAGTVARADDTAVRISFGGRKDVPVLSHRVARIVLRPPRQSVRYEESLGRTGLFLKNGDFLESEFRAIEWGTISMSSVLFGLKRFGIEGGEPMVCVLNDCVPAKTPYEVRLLDGSFLRASNISANEDGVTIDEPLLGQFSVSSSDIFRISRTDHADGPASSKNARNLP